MIRARHVASAVAAALAMGALAVGPLARAQDLQYFTFSNVGPSETINVKVGATETDGVLAGIYKGDLESLKQSGPLKNYVPDSTTERALATFCVDVRHEISGGNSYSTLVNLGAVTAGAGSLQLESPSVTSVNGTAFSGYYYETGAGSGGYGNGTGAGLASALISGDYTPDTGAGFLTMDQRASKVAWLIDKYLPVYGTLSAAQAAEIQVAIWDITINGNNTTGNTGSFQYLGNNGAVTQAGINSYILQADDTYNPDILATQALWLQAPGTDSSGVKTNHLQEYGFTLRTTSIPEPMFVQLAALIGLGGLGLFRLRRRVG